MSLQGFPAANTHVLSDVSDQLAIKALTSSTQDRDEEDKKNLLSRSKCQSGVPEDQSLCPCKDGDKPCYWSSCATTHENSNEWISFRLNSMVPHRCNTLQHIISPRSRSKRRGGAPEPPCATRHQPESIRNFRKFTFSPQKF